MTEPNDSEPNDSEWIAGLFGRSSTEPEPTAPPADDNTEWIRALFTDSPKEES